MTDADPIGLPGGVSVRPARPAELPAIGRLTVAAYVADGHVPDGDPYTKELADAAGRDREADLLVAVAGDRVLGTVTVCQPGTPYAEISRPGEWEVRMLAVHPHARGLGAGRALMSAAVSLARAAGCRRMVLSSGDGMRAAHRIYRAMGFRRAPDRDWLVTERLLLLAFELEIGP